MPKQRSAPKKLPVPKTLEEAAEAERRLGELLAQMHEQEAAFEKMHHELDVQESAVIEPLHEEIIALGKSIYAYAKSHRGLLTDSGRLKTYTMPKKAGTVRWYTTPPSVQITGAEAVLQRIKELGLLQFIRTKEEINKEAMLEDPSRARTIAGVQIGKREKFAITPTGAKERVECDTTSKRFSVVRLK